MKVLLFITACLWCCSWLATGQNVCYTNVPCPNTDSAVEYCNTVCVSNRPGSFGFCHQDSAHQCYRKCLCTYTAPTVNQTCLNGKCNGGITGDIACSQRCITAVNKYGSCEVNNMHQCYGQCICETDYPETKTIH